MYAGMGSNACVTNVGHTMFARVGDVYCVARGSSRSAARNLQLLQTKEGMTSPMTKHVVITGIITAIGGLIYYERSLEIKS